MTDLTPIQSRLAGCFRRLESPEKGEKVAAWQAIVRVLNGIGADFRDVADCIEHSGNGALNEAEMQEIYEAGIKEGEKRAEYKQNHGHRGAPQPRFPSAQDMATYCYQRIDGLNDWEAEFITNMVSWTRRRPLSVRQQSRLEEVYLKLGGRI